MQNQNMAMNAYLLYLLPRCLELVLFLYVYICLLSKGLYYIIYLLNPICFSLSSVYYLYIGIYRVFYTVLLNFHGSAHIKI
jgi:hypothetical protein